MLKIFISQPMSGLSMEDIKKTREKMIEQIKKKISKDKFEVIDSIKTNEEYINGNAKHEKLWYLGESIKCMAEADIVLMANHWEESIGCVIEMMIANKYKMPVLENIGEVVKYVK